MATNFTLEFHGVRGSLPTPGARTAEVGGNTSCVEVRAGDTRLFLDAGTGLRGVGQKLLGRPLEATILLSHVHWDHIQGLPFFTPIYVPGNRIEVVSGPNGFMPLEGVLAAQMKAPFFPVNYEEVSAQLKARDVRSVERFEVGNVQVQVQKLNHPDPVYGYRLTCGGKSIVYATDTEHFACVDPFLRRLAENADVLIYDAQYTPEEYTSKVGWGHSTWAAATELARAANVKQLVLFHHDPLRSDDAVMEIEARARAVFPNTVAAREGTVHEVGEREVQAAVG